MMIKILNKESSPHPGMMKILRKVNVETESK